MLDTNKVFLTGRLGKDPKVGDTKNGKKWARASLASSKRLGENKFGTTWTTIVAFGAAANILSDCHKGDFLYVAGEINSNSYEKDGKKIYETSVLAQTVARVIGKKEEQSQEEDVFSAPAEGEIPF